MGAYIYRVTSPKNNRVIEVDGAFHQAAVAVYAFKPYSSWSRARRDGWSKIFGERKLANIVE